MTEQIVSHIRQLTALLGEATSLDEVRTRLEKALLSLEQKPIEEASTKQRTRGRSYFDRLIEKMLDQVKRAVSRETLVEETLQALSEDADAQIAECYLVLEGFIHSDGSIGELAVPFSAGIQKQRLANFVSKRLESRLEEMTR